MRVVPLELQGLLKLQDDVRRDDRGAFIETWNRRKLAELGIEVDFVQDNLSISRQWTIRGLHYQIQQAQGKLVRVSNGEIHDVVVDLRRSSPTFGRATAVRLSAEAYEALWVPPGFAHGFVALRDDTRVTYKVTDYWAPQFERTLAWNDPLVRSLWPLPARVEPLVAPKDAAGVLLRDAECYP
jgi:dTDP-4-dehydrorhamnose 3,5-epimerase